MAVPPLRSFLRACRKLSKLQNFVLDAAGPLAAAYEELVTKEEPDPDLIQQAVQLALRILGNTSTHFAQERRTRALGRLNPDLKSLVEDEDFSKAGPSYSERGSKRRPKNGEVPKKGHTCPQEGGELLELL